MGLWPKPAAASPFLVKDKIFTEMVVVKNKYCEFRDCVFLKGIEIKSNIETSLINCKMVNLSYPTWKTYPVDLTYDKKKT